MAKVSIEVDTECGDISCSVNGTPVTDVCYISVYSADEAKEYGIKQVNITSEEEMSEDVKKCSHITASKKDRKSKKLLSADAISRFLKKRLIDE